MSRRPARDKLLAEWFWTDRWTGSSGFLLPLEARGLYREMLTQAWQRGGRLPSDPEAIQRACGVTRAEWNRAWPKVQRYWREAEPGILVNDTQLEVLNEAKAGVERASERGRRGAQARHEHSPESAQAPAQAQHKDKPPSPSPSRTAATAAVPGGSYEPQIRGAFLARDAKAKLVQEGEGFLDRLMQAGPDQDRGWLLRQHSTVPGSGAYLVRLDTAKDEHLVRTVNSLRDAVERQATSSGERGGLLTAEELERRRVRG